MIALLRLRTLGRFRFSSLSTLTLSPHIEPESGDKGKDRRVPSFSTVTLSQHHHNYVALAGIIELPFKKMFGKTGDLGAYTLLIARPRPSHPPFRILVSVWEMLAERALVHLKQNDYIYVCGRLGTYTSCNFEEAERLYYKVTANEISYVQVPDERYLVAAQSGEETGEFQKLKPLYRLHLLELLFANPDEWYDHRNTKKNSRYPDFKHRNTGEAIWLMADDPQWVKEQLKIIDSRHTGTPPAEVPFGSFTSDLLDDISLTRTTGKSFLARKSKVTANDVQVPDESYQVAAKSGLESGESLEQKHKRLLPLWLSVFANPDEWYDYRKTKKWWRHHDFKHKKTGELLWLNADDPSWVKHHLELLDSKATETPSCETPFGSFTSGRVSGHEFASFDPTDTDDSYRSAA